MSHGYALDLDQNFQKDLKILGTQTFVWLDMQVFLWIYCCNVVMAHR